MDRGSMPRQVLDHSRASQATHPPRQRLLSTIPQSEIRSSPGGCSFTDIPNPRLARSENPDTSASAAGICHLSFVISTAIGYWQSLSPCTPFQKMNTVTSLKTTESNLRGLIDAALEQSGGLLRLAPCWGSRSFLQPGRRLQ